MRQKVSKTRIPKNSPKKAISSTNKSLEVKSKSLPQLCSPKGDTVDQIKTVETKQSKSPSKKPVRAKMHQTLVDFFNKKNKKNDESLLDSQSQACIGNTCLDDAELRQCKNTKIHSDASKQSVSQNHKQRGSRSKKIVKVDTEISKSQQPCTVKRTVIRRKCSKVKSHQKSLCALTDEKIEPPKADKTEPRIDLQENVLVTAYTTTSEGFLKTKEISSSNNDLSTIKLKSDIKIAKNVIKLQESNLSLKQANSCSKIKCETPRAQAKTPKPTKSLKTILQTKSDTKIHASVCGNKSDESYCRNSSYGMPRPKRKKNVPLKRQHSRSLAKTYEQLGLGTLVRSPSSENFFPRLTRMWTEDTSKKEIRFIKKKQKGETKQSLEIGNVLKSNPSSTSAKTTVKRKRLIKGKGPKKSSITRL